MLRHIVFRMAMIAAVGSACAQTPVRVAAAADLEPVLPHICGEFENSSGIHMQVTYQASAALATQIENGAPFDVFLSADMAYPKRLIAKGLASGASGPDSSTPINYANGTLVLWARKDSSLPPPSLELLRSQALRRLAIANPERAPYGRAAVEALTRLKVYDSLRGRLVTAENIAQAAQFVDSGNADAGLISLTSALTPRLSSSGSYFVIPRDLYPQIQQGAVVLSKTTRRLEAQKFLDFLISASVQAELAQAGLTPAHK